MRTDKDHMDYANVAHQIRALYISGLLKRGWNSALVLFGSAAQLPAGRHIPIPMFPARGEAQCGNSPAPLSLSGEDVRLVETLGRCGPDDHSPSGNALIDAQHQRLSDYAADLRATILSGRPVDEVNAIIDAFVRDVVQHFQEEEAILAAANHPGTAKHAALHRELVNGAAALVVQFRAGALGIGELFRFLAHDVLAKHMLGADRDFIPCFEGSR